MRMCLLAREQAREHGSAPMGAAAWRARCAGMRRYPAAAALHAGMRGGPTCMYVASAGSEQRSNVAICSAASVHLEDICCRQARASQYR
jgi:hypothetical protein